MRSKKSALVISALTVALLATGCATGAAESGEAKVEQGRGSSDATAAQAVVDAGSKEVILDGDLGVPLSAPADLSGKTVYYIPISLQVPYFAMELESTTEALESVGATVRGCDGQFAPTSIVQCMDQAIGAGAAAVITSAVPYEMASAGYEKLRSASIPSLLVISSPPEDGNVPSGLHYLEEAFMTHPAQELASQAVIADSDGAANVLFLKIIDSPALIAAGDAGIRTFEQNCSNCEVTTVEVSGARADEIPSLVSTQLLSNPSIDYVIPQTAAHLATSITGVQNANATSRVKFATTTGTLAGLQTQKSNPAIIANAASSTDYSGWIIGDATIRMITGTDVPTEYPPVYRIFTTDNIDSLELTPEAERTNDWFGPASYVDGFKALWAGQ